MIAERIYNGESAEEIGLTKDKHESRKETLDRYLATTGGAFDPKGYLEWLRQDAAGDRGSGGTIVSEPIRCCTDKGKMPTAAKMGLTLAREMVTFAKSGFKTVSTDEAQRRLGICQACEFFTGKRCLKCGCFMIAKTKLATTACPIGKWKQNTEV